MDGWMEKSGDGSLDSLKNRNEKHRNGEMNRELFRKMEVGKLEL